jgi:serine phosphatase RsbU (regulator of sigma subunit)
VARTEPGTALLRAARLAPAHEIPRLLRRHAAELGYRDAIAYLADLQQVVLVPFLSAVDESVDVTREPLSVDASLGGRAFSHLEVLTQSVDGGRQRVWLPLLAGAERLGALMVELDSAATEAAIIDDLSSVAAVVAALVATKSDCGDTLVRLRRTTEMGLAAEMQRSLLPPLSFASAQVAIAGALEPAYEVAGDTVDYAVDADVARAAVFDGMGHGLRSAMLASVAVAAYRNARRAGRPLPAVGAAVDQALHAGFGGSVFTTGVLIELDTATGQLRWMCAGHPPPLLLRGGRLVRRLTVSPALPFGLAVADVDRSDPIVGREQLEPGDLLVLYSDGVTEAHSPSGEQFGEERLVDHVVRQVAAGLPPAETLRRLVHALLAHQQDQLSDDATLLLVQWRPEPMPNLGIRAAL